MSEVTVSAGVITLYQATCPICGMASPFFTIRQEGVDWYVIHSNSHPPAIMEISVNSVPTVAADGSIVLSVTTQKT